MRYRGVGGGDGANKGGFEALLSGGNNHRTIVLVDDGAATGATLIVASKWINQKLRQRQQRKQEVRFIIAVPVAPKDTVSLFKRECNAEVEVVTSPSTTFRSVSQYYQRFDPVSDEEVVEIMKARRLLP